MIGLRRWILAATCAAALVASSLAGASAAQAVDATGTLTGVITAPGGGVPDANISLKICSVGAGYCASMGSDQYTYDSTTGSYTATGIPVGNWAFQWTYQGSSNYLRIYYQSGYFDDFIARRVGLAFAAGSVVTQNIALIPPVTISGAVQGYGGVSLGYDVSTLTARRTGGNAYLGSVDPTTGSYSFSQLPPGTYSFDVHQPDGWVFTPSRYDGLVLVAGTNLTENIVLDHLGIVAGHAFVDDGSGPRPYAHGNVSAGAYGYATSVSTDANGAFTISVPDTNANVCITGNEFVQTTCGSPIHVPLNTTQSGYDLSTVETGTVAVALLGSFGAGSGTFPVTQGSVQMWRRDDNTGVFTPFRSAVGINQGYGVVDGLPTGTYRLRAIDDEDNLNAEWWSNSRYFSQATDIHVVAGQYTNLGVLLLPSHTFDVTRTAGLDRFSGAVAMSKDVYGLGDVPAEGVPVVYIANGLNYPDALSAGPAAAHQHGVLLLVLPTSIPASVAAELTRLRPQRIVVAGGPGSVSDSVLAQLGAYSSAVDRMDGSDRFAASRAIASDAFASAPEVFIATGANYPDALSAGPAAGSIDAPVILVNGSESTLDEPTRALLQSLHTTDVDIAGGPGSVSPGLAASLADFLGGTAHVTRYSGEDRYEAAASIDEAFFPDSETSFLASGANFPDALTGVPLATAYGGPIYLVRPDCIPVAAAQGIVAGDTEELWLLGGPGSLTNNVYDQRICTT